MEVNNNVSVFINIDHGVIRLKTVTDLNPTGNNLEMSDTVELSGEKNDLQKKEEETDRLVNQIAAKIRADEAKQALSEARTGNKKPQMEVISGDVNALDEYDLSFTANEKWKRLV
ncbi:MAG: hypothetical protein ABRQ37_21485 [Candidatus Eremiobacterota bacterium]